MKRYVFVFVLGAAVGAVGHWYFTEGNGQRDWRQARERVSRGAGRLAENVRGAASEVWTNDIREELARSGMVVREKAARAGHAIADAAANARITAAIKGKYLREAGLAALNINVDTTDGLVTLSGTASSPEEIARATQLALETDGVHKVISTIQLKSRSP